MRCIYFEIIDWKVNLYIFVYIDGNIFQVFYFCYRK